MSIEDSVIAAASDATIENVTVVVEGNIWNLVISAAGIVVTAFVSWLIYRGNVKRSDTRAREERSRHKTELKRLRKESKRAQNRHKQEIKMMLAQGRREREVRFLREVSDQLIQFADAARTRSLTLNEGYALRLRQYSYKVLADFTEDDYEFATALSSTLGQLSNECALVLRHTETFTNANAFERLAVDAEEASYRMLSWLHPDYGAAVTKDFTNFLQYGRFFREDES